MERTARDTVLIGGIRTPFVKAGGALTQFSMQDLAVRAVKELAARMPQLGTSVDEVVLSTVLLDPRTPNWAREVVFGSGLSHDVYADSVSNNCISSLVALARASERIAGGRTGLAVVGGTESMSNPTLVFKERAIRFFMGLSRSRTVSQKLGQLGRFRPGFLLPDPPGVVEPSTGISMGGHMEITAKEIGIAREAQDEVALKSHLRAASACSENLLQQDIFELEGISQDTLIRPNTSIEKLAKLRPVFDREQGTLTAGNSSPLTDGACVLGIASRERAEALGLQIRARVVDYEFAALSPDAGLLMAPALALPRLLARHNLELGAFDAVEIHEAFAAQVLANAWAWENGWKEPAVGALDWDKTNLWGGSIALGHPLAATGARVALQLANRLKHEGGKLGLLSVCAAGGMACAMILESE